MGAIRVFAAKLIGRIGEPDERRELEQKLDELVEAGARDASVALECQARQERRDEHR